MKKVFVLFVLLGIAGSAFASTDWLTNAASDNWFSSANWSGGVPNATLITNARTFQTHMNTTYMPRIGTDQPGYVAATANQLEVGGDNDAISPTKSIGRFTMDSGTLTINDYLRSGASSTSNRWGAIYMNDGTINVGGQFTVGWGSTTIDVRGYLYMIGGTINVHNGTSTDKFVIGNAAGATGIATISGGTINADDFQMKVTAGTGTVKLDVSGTGKVVINGDKRALLEGYVDNGWIYSNGEMQTGYDMISYNATTDKTTIAVPEPATLCLLGLGALSLIRRK